MKLKLRKAPWGTAPREACHWAKPDREGISPSPAPPWAPVRWSLSTLPVVPPWAGACCRRVCSDQGPALRAPSALLSFSEPTLPSQQGTRPCRVLLGSGVLPQGVRPSPALLPVALPPPPSPALQGSLHLVHWPSFWLCLHLVGRGWFPAPCPALIRIYCLYNTHFSACVALKSGPALEADTSKTELGDWELEGRAEGRRAADDAVTGRGHPHVLCRFLHRQLEHTCCPRTGQPSGLKAAPSFGPWTSVC